MKSIIIIEVEHGEDTDDFQQAYADCLSEVQYNGLEVVDSTVVVDLPATFVLDSDMPSRDAIFKACAASPREIMQLLTPDPWRNNAH